MCPNVELNHHLFITRASGDRVMHTGNHAEGLCSPVELQPPCAGDYDWALLQAPTVGLFAAHKQDFNSVRHAVYGC